MGQKLDKLYSVGEFASKAGVTQRTIRYYDNIGLLKPSTHNDSGHRLYSRHDFARLQKILTLKFIGLSLEDISDIIKYDVNDTDFKKSLEIQRDIMDKKVHHISMVMSAINEALDMVNDVEALNWDKFINIIKVINIDENWMEQYENASNLKARIKIHEHFSTNKQGWMRWYFEQLCIPKNSYILELGCGDGSLWAKNSDRIRDDWDITLTDFSLGMLKDAKNNLENLSHRFKFKIADAESIPFEDSSFDIVIANHMLYHVPEIEKAFLEISRILKPGGCFYASTVGKNHMDEMRHIVTKFDSDTLTTRSFNITEKFQLENGMAQISRWFQDIEFKRYEDSLVVTDPLPLIDYIFSMPGNVKEIFNNEKLQKLIDFVQIEIEKTGGVYITKDTGFFKAIKY